MKKQLLSILLCLVILFVCVATGCTKKGQTNQNANQNVNQNAEQNDDKNDKQDDEQDDKQDAGQDDKQDDKQDAGQDDKQDAGQKAEQSTKPSTQQNDKKEETPKATFHIIKNSKTDYVIVRSANATKTEVYAAEELQSYLKKISGATLKIVTDATAAAKNEIIVGKTNREKKGDFDRTELGEDGFVIKTAGTKLWLVGGGNRGTLYSVYTFLEDYLGCRYYTDTIEKVPETKNVSIVEIKEDKQIPQITYRDTDWMDYMGENISVKQKLNANLWSRSLSDKVGGGISFAGGAGGHTHFAFVPPTDYFESHPEYYSLIDGSRVAAQLCLTNKDVVKITIENVKKYLRQYPNAEYVAVSQQDNWNFCECSNCMKVYKEGGNAYSEVDIRFVNQVAEGVKAEFPNVTVVTYGYDYTRKAPKTAPAENVLVELATMGTCFNHAKEGNRTCFASGISEGSEINKGHHSSFFCDDLENWGKLTDNLLIYDYSTNYYAWCMTWPDFDLLQKNINWYARNGIKAVKWQGNQFSKSIEFGELRAYLISKLLWNPHMTEKEYYEHMDDFLEGVYGPGGKYIHQYIELAQELVDDEQHFGVGVGAFDMYPLETYDAHDASELPSDLTVAMIKGYENVDWTKYWNWYTDTDEHELTVKGKKLFGKALALAKTESQKTQIRKIYLQVDYLKSYYYYQKISDAEGQIFDLIDNYISANASQFTQQEKNTLPSKILQLATEQMYNKYEAYNMTLCEALIEAGVTYRWEGSNLDGWQGFDFTQLPTMWPT